MNWMRRLFGKAGSSEPAADSEKPVAGSATAPDEHEVASGTSAERPKWLAPDDPGNPFRVELLNLMGNLQYTAMTKDRDIAARSISWRPGQHARLARPERLDEVRCDLAFPAADELPDGMLFCPPCMEDKWVIAWVDGEIRMARSWTGETMVVAPARLQGGSLRVERVLLDTRGALTSLGDPVRIVDWMVRVHALGQRIPLAVSDDGARALEQTPLLGFSLFGRRLFAAARDFTYPEPSTVICSDGAVAAAIQAKQAETLERLLAEGASATAPSTLGGYRPIHLAMIVKSRAVLEVLLRHGVDANQRALRGARALHAGISVGVDLELLDVLLSHGADIEAGDDKGFRPLHEAAQRDSAELARWLLQRGADMEARTENGLTPLHVACGNGSLGVARVLQEAGANLRAESPLGTPIAIAEAEGKTNVRDWLLSQWS